jgi:hypothetical protein
MEWRDKAQILPEVSGKNGPVEIFRRTVSVEKQTLGIAAVIRSLPPVGMIAFAVGRLPLRGLVHLRKSYKHSGLARKCNECFTAGETFDE